MSQRRLENGIACPTRAPAPGSDRSEIGFRLDPRQARPFPPESAGKGTATSRRRFTLPFDRAHITPAPASRCEAA